MEIHSIYLNDVKSKGYEYQGPLDQNSNTFVREAVRNAHLPQPTGDVADQYGNTTHYWTPGADRLTNPIKQDRLSNAVNTARDAFDNRFGKWGSSPEGVAEPPVSDRPQSFDNRFGNWGSVPASASGDVGSPVLRALQKYRRSATSDRTVPPSVQGGLPATLVSHASVAGSGGVPGRPIRDSLITPVEAVSSAGPILRGTPAATLPINESTYGDRSEEAPGARKPDTYPQRKVSSAFPGITPLDPDQQPPERAPMPGIFSGKPMSESLLPGSIRGLPDNSNALGDGDWSNLLAGITSRNSTQPQPPAAAAAALAPSVDRSYSGGLLGRFVALAGIDPQNVNQPAAPMDDEVQADLGALDARLSNSGNIRDAVALYNARRSGRR